MTAIKTPRNRRPWARLRLWAGLKLVQRQTKRLETRFSTISGIEYPLSFNSTGRKLTCISSQTPSAGSRRPEVRALPHSRQPSPFPRPLSGRVARRESKYPGKPLEAGSSGIGQWGRTPFLPWLWVLSGDPGPWLFPDRFRSWVWRRLTRTPVVVGMPARPASPAWLGYPWDF